MSRYGPAPLVDEAKFIPRDLCEARALYAALVGAKVSPAVARSVVMWLVTLPEKRSDDPSSDVQRSKYRQMLARLGEPPWSPGRRRGDSLVASRYKGALLSRTDLSRALFSQKGAA